MKDCFSLWLLFLNFSWQNTHLEINLDALQVQAGCQSSATVNWEARTELCLMWAAAICNCQENREHLGTSLWRQQGALLSCSHCWILPGILQDPKVKGQFRNSERIWPWKKFSRFPRARQFQAFINNCILSTLLTFFYRKPRKLTLLSDHHPNSLYSASGHSEEKTEHRKWRKQNRNCHSITTGPCNEHLCLL